MDSRRVVMIAMPCNEVVEVGGVLDALYAANQVLASTGATDRGYTAEVVGFGSPETMRVAFRRTLGVSPAAYRSRFSHTSDARVEGIPLASG